VAVLEADAGEGVPLAALRHPPTPPPAAAAETCELQNESYVSSVGVPCTPAIPPAPLLLPPPPPGGPGAVGMSKVLDGRKDEDEDEDAGVGVGA